MASSTSGLRVGGWLRTAKAVAWSFFGVRRKDEFEQDMLRLNPFQVVLMGLVGAMLLVIGLMLLVRWVVA